MNKTFGTLIKSLVVVSFSMATTFIVPAQIIEPDTKSGIIERIEEQSDGNVEIVIPENILRLILIEPESKKPAEHKDNIRPGINKLQGFRIQVFSDGRNQHSLESRAKARGSAIVAKFPKYRGQVYTYSSSPNWYTRIGNFRNQQEATSALQELKRAFPSFATEMRVVKSQIVIIK